MDMEFYKVVPEIPEVVVNTSAASGHVAEVKRQIRVIKERCWAFLAVMPFKKIPIIMTISLVHFCVFWLNATPAKSWISLIYGPRRWISQQKLDAKKWCILMCREYVEVHKENTMTNSMKPRTRPAICMGLTGNIQWPIKFMCVETGRKIVWWSYTKLPMPDVIIKKVEGLAKKDRAQDGIIFRNQQREIFEWDNKE